MKKARRDGRASEMGRCGQSQPPARASLFRRDGVRLFLGIGWRWIVSTVIFEMGEECGQRIHSGFGLAIDLGDLSVRRAQRLGQPARGGE